MSAQPKFLRIEDTAAEDPSIPDAERREMFDMIKWMYKNVSPTMAHSKTWSLDMDHYLLRFFDIEGDVSVTDHLSPFVENFHCIVKNATVVLPEQGGLPVNEIVVEVFKPSSKRPFVFKKHVPSANRGELFSEKAKYIAASRKIALPKTWDADVEVMKTLSELMNNKSDDDITMQCTILGARGEPTGVYVLEFSGVKSVSYDFVEAIALSSIGRSVKKIFFASEGRDKRKVACIVGQKGAREEDDGSVGSVAFRGPHKRKRHVR